MKYVHSGLGTTVHICDTDPVDSAERQIACPDPITEEAVWNGASSAFTAESQDLARLALGVIAGAGANKMRRNYACEVRPGFVLLVAVGAGGSIRITPAG